VSLITASSALTEQTDAAAAETGASPLQESLQLNYNRDLMEEKIYEILKLSNLLLQSLQESFSLTHESLLLISDQLFHLRAPSLNGTDQLRQGFEVPTLLVDTVSHHQVQDFGVQLLVLWAQDILHQTGAQVYRLILILMDSLQKTLL
ncbi:hypothetical protein JZ751_007543, partial [Albula glossodonta]